MKTVLLSILSILARKIKIKQSEFSKIDSTANECFTYDYYYYEYLYEISYSKWFKSLLSKYNPTKSFDTYLEKDFGTVKIPLNRWYDLKLLYIKWILDNKINF